VCVCVCVCVVCMHAYAHIVLHVYPPICIPVTNQEMLKQIFITINTGGFYEKFSSHLTSVETDQK